jgi:hypothetical protein
MFRNYTAKMNTEKRQHIRDMGPIVDGEYISFQNDVNYAINMLGHVNVNIYTDASGTTFAIDSSGNPIQNALIQRMVYTYPYLDQNNNTVDGSFQIFFYNGGSWANSDANYAAYWYSIEGILPVTIYQFT